MERSTSTNIGSEQFTQQNLPLNIQSHLTSQRISVKDVGIHAIEIYFPSTFVDQGDLEVFDKAGKGKYTIGLGQLKMAAVNDREDVNSISLTCVRNLLKKHNIDPRQVGRLEVGTETLLDKSKSVKTTLMELFKGCGNYDIEGVTTFNACYGGTNALFNTINWVQSNAYDGRFGLVLCSDVAVYPKGNARPTGGVGAIAMLIGPNAPLVFDDLRSTYIDNYYDFYKPNPSSEYPTVDGNYSIKIYLGALTQCFETLKQKHYTLNKDGSVNYHFFDQFCFHTPFSKMVQKAFYHLILHDIVTSSDSGKRYSQDLMNELRALSQDSLSNLKSDDPKVLKVLQKHLDSDWVTKCEKNLQLAKNLGNIYTGSLYNGLLSLLNRARPETEGGEGLDIRGKKVCLFSYGSGCAASMFVIRVSQDTKKVNEVIGKSRFQERLENRVKITPEDFDRWMALREQNFGKCPYTPTGSIDQLFDGTYYLTKIDEKYRRYYAIKGEQSSSLDEPKASGALQSSKTSSSDQNSGAVSRLNAMKRQLLAAKSNNNGNGGTNQSINNQQLDPSVLRSVMLTKLYPELDTEMLRKGGLSPDIADYMIENCIGVMPLPLGLGLGFKVNGRNYIVPMALEEPSVIAACSAIAKLIGEKGTGFQCQSTPPVMIAQIQVAEITDFNDALYKIKVNKREIIKNANQFCENMVKRGGGVEDIRVRQLGEQHKDAMIVVELLVNVCDSMGANVVNTIAEQSSPFIQKILGQGRVAVRILSNLCTERLTMAEFSVPIKHMNWKNINGQLVVERIIEAQRFAELDQYRATTHNKGIMNGIDAVAVALGQDWRAIEAGAHSYAAIGDRYLPLTRYRISKDGQNFEGRIELPLSVGTKGGAIETNPSYINTHSILGFPSAQELGHIMAAVGLAQNLAAIRALSVEGIQRGHMNLHARNVAIQAGVLQDLVPEVVEFMKMRNKINVKAAQHYLKGHELFKIHQRRSPQHKRDLSTFYVEIRENFLPEPLILTILLDCKTQKRTYHLSIEKEPKLTPDESQLMNHLFGGNKGFEWMTSFLGLLQVISYTRKIPIKKELIMTQYRLKLLTLLANFLTSHLLSFDELATNQFVGKLLDYLENCSSGPSAFCQETAHLEIRKSIPEPSPNHDNKVENLVLPYGFSLLQEITFNFVVYCNADVQSSGLRQALITEYRGIMNSLCESKKVFDDAINIIKSNGTISEEMLHEYMRLKRKKMVQKMMILTDCISVEEPIPEGLLEFIQKMSEVSEIRGVTYKDLQAISTGATNQNLTNNLFYFWLLHKKGLQALNQSNDLAESLALKTEFFQFIETYCHELMEKKYKLRENPFFDAGVFDETMKLIETYYKLDPTLAMMAKRGSSITQKL